MHNLGRETRAHGAPKPAHNSDLPASPVAGYHTELLKFQAIPLGSLRTVYHFRPFRNSDPPRLAEIWREQPPQRGVMQAVSATILEQLVFAKPYFDPKGLIVALEDNLPIGFVHAGFGANDSLASIDTELGTTYLLMLRAEHRHSEIAHELLSRSEQYLRERGAKVLYAGGIRPLNGFYLGLYGGSELPGILTTDPIFHEAAARNGYREIDRVVVLQLELARFRPPITRDQRRLRRELSFTEHSNPPDTSWWDACTTGAFERLRFTLEPPGSDPSASVSFWDVEPLSTSWGVPSAGMFDLEVNAACRQQGLATFLLTEAFQRLRNRGIARVEAQTMQHNEPAVKLYEKLGFNRVDEGVVYRKEQ
jgi:ribosomal protein S18 acetylase RimI-like enzyme